MKLNKSVRINGTSPDITTLGSEQISERAAEVKKSTITNTSCSIITNSKTNKKFHILVDVGQRIVNSIENGAYTTGLDKSIQEHIPNAILITHSHNDHINELPLIIEKAISTSKKIEIFCTKECFKILEKFPQLSSYSRTNTNISINTIQPFNS